MFADKVINFNKSLEFKNQLPDNIGVMNPFKNNTEVLKISEAFYKKFYSDHLDRKLILGINPGRLGAGVTGIPFTDSKRLIDDCGIEIKSVKTHEPSSVFIYEMIKQFGGPEKFYAEFYISSVSPLGFVEETESGKWNNLNYYDYPLLFEIVKPFIIEQLKRQINLGIDTSKVFILGKRNALFFKKINDEYHFFDTIVVLDHPRYIEQYKSKFRNDFIQQYLRAFRQSS